MTSDVRMFAGVTISRRVAAQRRAALLAGAEMNPRVADLHTLRAFANFRLLDGGDGFDVQANGHWFLTRRRSMFSNCARPMRPVQFARRRWPCRLRPRQRRNVSPTPSGRRPQQKWQADWSLVGWAAVCSLSKRARSQRAYPF